MIFWVLVGFILGIASASFWGAYFFTLFIIFLFGLILIALIFPLAAFKKIAPLVVIFFFGFSLGFWRFNLDLPKIDENHLAFYNGQKIVWRGEIISAPEVKITGKNYLVSALEIKNPVDRKIAGRALISMPFYADFKYGDLVEISGSLMSPPVSSGILNYQEYLAGKNIYSQMFDPEAIRLASGRGFSGLAFIYDLRDKINASFQKYLTEPQTSLGLAMFLGEQGLLPISTKTDFNTTGLSHILAISGSNFAIIMSFLSLVLIRLGRVSRRKIFYFLLFFSIFYLAIIGWPPSAVRSAIMILIFILGQMFGRKFNSVRLIVLTACLMLLFQPQLLVFDIGFQLSFLAVFGLCFLPPVLMKFFSFLPNYRFFPFRTYAVTTLSAQIFTIPLIIYYFGNLSLISFLANLLVLPIMPIFFIALLLFAVLIIFLPIFGTILSWPIWVMASYLLFLTKFLSAWPGANLKLGSFSFIWIFVFYFLLIIFFMKQNISRIKIGEIQEIVPEK